MTLWHETLTRELARRAWSGGNHDELAEIVAICHEQRIPLDHGVRFHWERARQNRETVVPRFSVSFAGQLQPGEVALAEFEIFCPDHGGTPRLEFPPPNFLDEIGWTTTPHVQHVAEGHYRFHQNFHLQYQGRDCKMGTYACHFSLVFPQAPADALGRFLRGDFRFQVGDLKSGARRLTIEATGGGLGNVQGVDISGFSEVSVKVDGASSANLLQGLSVGAPPREPARSTVLFPLARDEEARKRHHAERVGAPHVPDDFESVRHATHRLTLGFTTEPRRVLMIAKTKIGLGRASPGGSDSGVQYDNDLIIRWVPPSDETAGISRKHARLELDPAGLHVIDSSKIGTTIEDRVLAQGERHVVVARGQFQPFHLERFQMELRAIPVAGDESLALTDEHWRAAGARVLPTLWRIAKGVDVDAVHLRRVNNYQAEEYLVVHRQATIGDTPECAIQLSENLGLGVIARVFHAADQFFLQQIVDETLCLMKVGDHVVQRTELIPLVPGQVVHIHESTLNVLKGIQWLGDDNRADTRPFSP